MGEFLTLLFKRKRIIGQFNSKIVEEVKFSGVNVKTFSIFSFDSILGIEGLF